MGDHSFARLIKRRRDALGFSQARLGELVGRSASTIRNWERGNSTPSERSDAVALAAVLGLDEREVLEGAGFDVAEAGAHQTLEQGYASLAPERHSAPEVAAGERSVGEASVVEESSDTSASFVDEDFVETNDRSVPAPEQDRVEESGDVDAGVSREAAEDESGETQPDRLDAPGEQEEPADADVIPPWPQPESGRAQADDRLVAVPRSVGTPADRVATPPPTESSPASRRLARAAPPTVLEATPSGEPSYLEDPGERQQYRIRAVVTAALVIGLVIVLLWAFGRATDAFSSLWDDFFSQLRV